MSFDILKSVLDFILTIWNIVGFFAFSKGGYYTVIFRGSRAVRYSENVFVLKIPFYEHSKYVQHCDLSLSFNVYKKRIAIISKWMSYTVNCKIINPVFFLNSIQFEDTNSTIQYEFLVNQLTNIIKPKLFNNDNIVDLNKEYSSYGFQLLSIEISSKINIIYIS